MTEPPQRWRKFFRRRKGVESTSSHGKDNKSHKSGEQHMESGLDEAANATINRDRMGDRSKSRSIFSNSDTDDQTSAYAIKCAIVDDEGKAAQVLCLFDSGSDSSFITTEALDSAQRQIQLKVRPLPPGKQHVFRSVMHGDYKSNNFVKIRVKNPIIGLESTYVNLRIIPSVEQDGTKDLEGSVGIIFGRDFINRNGPNLYQRIPDAALFESNLLDISLDKTKPPIGRDTGDTENRLVHGNVESSEENTPLTGEMRSINFALGVLDTEIYTPISTSEVLRPSELSQSAEKDIPGQDKNTSPSGPVSQVDVGVYEERTVSKHRDPKHRAASIARAGAATAAVAGVVEHFRSKSRHRDGRDEERWSEDEDYVIKRRVIRQRSSSPNHKRHLAEGALAGAGAAALLAHHKHKQGESVHSKRNVVGGAALGAISAQVITRARSRYRDSREGRSRSRSSSHSRVKTGLRVAAAAVIAATAIKLVRDRKANKEELVRGRSRTRSRSRSRARSRSVGGFTDSTVDPKLGLVQYGTELVYQQTTTTTYENTEGSSRGRSRRRRDSSSSDSRRTRSRSRSQSRSRSRSRARSRSVGGFTDSTVDPELGLVQYGTEPVYQQTTTTTYENTEGGSRRSISYMHDNSSPPSLIWDTGSIKTVSTDTFSVNNIVQVENLFTDILLKDTGIRTLLLDCHRELGTGLFAIRLEILLKQMSLSLAEESTESIHHSTSKFVKRRVRHLACIMEAKFDTQGPVEGDELTIFPRGQFQGAPDINSWLDLTTSDEPLEDNKRPMQDLATNDLEDEADLPPLHLRPLETFILDSKALEGFREGLIAVLVKSWKDSQLPVPRFFDGAPQEVRHALENLMIKYFRARYQKQEKAQEPNAQTNLMLINVPIKSHGGPSSPSPLDTTKSLNSTQDNPDLTLKEKDEILLHLPKDTEIKSDSEAGADLRSYQESNLMSHVDKPQALSSPEFPSDIYSTARKMLRIILRPKVQDGFRRIEWICECGDEIYGDFENSDPVAVETLAKELHAPNVTAMASGTANRNGGQSSTGGETSNCEEIDLADLSPQTTLPSDQHSEAETARASSSSKSTVSEGLVEVLKFVAICVNTSTIKTLEEVEVSTIKSDKQLFDLLQEAYLKVRGWRTKFHFLLRPATMEYVRFTLCEIYEGSVEIEEKPNCFPPKEKSDDYDFPLQQPRMPPNVFIHFLNHGPSHSLPIKNIWTSRLSKRLRSKLISRDPPIEGWGMHIIEGANWDMVAGIIIVTVVLILLAAVLYSVLMKDVQGGTGMGAMLLAAPPLLMAAFMFKLTRA